MTLTLPVIVPLLTAVLTFLLRGHRTAARLASVGGAALLLAAAGNLLIQVAEQGFAVAQMGGWPAPFGITLVADHLSAAMVLITGITGLAVSVYACSDMDETRERGGFHAFYHVMLAGICGAFLTGDIFNLYVWFEVMLIASFALITLGGGKAQLDGAVRYVALNLVSTLLFLIAIAMLYGLTGTLNMAELHGALPGVGNQGLVNALAMLFMVAFGIKAAVFPLYFWLPASYHTPPVSVAAIFAALLTKVGVYALVRAFSLIFTTDVEFTHTVLLWVAGLTMVMGVLGAAVQTDVRRILSFHIISQIGYMVLGLALFTPLALAGAVFYLIHHIIVKANLFLIGGVMNRLAGSFALARLGGLYRDRPWLAVLFLVPAFSLAGFPPLSGFWAKFLVIDASLEARHYGAAAVALAVGLLTIYSMTKIWTQAFWKPLPEGCAAAASVRGGRLVLLVTPVAAMAFLTVLIGLWPQPFVSFAITAAEQLLTPDLYVAAVLGGGSP